MLENKGQVEVDSWIVASGVVGGIAFSLAARRGRIPFGTRSLIDGAGLGTVAHGEMGQRLVQVKCRRRKIFPGHFSESR